MPEAPAGSLPTSTTSSRSRASSPRPPPEPDLGGPALRLSTSAEEAMPQRWRATARAIGLDAHITATEELLELDRTRIDSSLQRSTTPLDRAAGPATVNSALSDLTMTVGPAKGLSE